MKIKGEADVSVVVIYLVNVAKMRALSWGGGVCWVNLRTNRRGVGLKVPFI